MDYEIRPAGPADWATLRDIRLAALTDTPHAFASTLEREQAYDERRWRDWLARTAFFLAWHGCHPVGIVGGLSQDAGGWHVISMWVSHPARGTGIARRLLEEVARHASAHGVASLTLWVTDGNDRARAFYRRAGFRSTGRRQLVPENPRQWEEEMTRGLAPAAG
jgi:ribosomal protein S18 acetylase RimI-like enzyme